MDWFDDLKEKLFGASVERSGQLHHGPLKRGEAFSERYEEWKRSTHRSDLLRHLRDLLQREQISSDTELHIFSTEQATGVQIKRPRDHDPDVLRFLLEEFKERVIEEGYRVHLSDHRIDPKGEERERYYLKPSIPPDRLQPPLPQRFGNVLIENWGDAGGSPLHLKILITVYNDRLYTPAESGMALINSLFAGRGRAFR